MHVCVRMRIGIPISAPGKTQHATNTKLLLGGASTEMLPADLPEAAAAALLAKGVSRRSHKRAMPSNMYLVVSV